MDRPVSSRLAAAIADSRRLQKRALLARLQMLRLSDELDSTLLHVGVRRYLDERAPAHRGVDTHLG